MRNILSGIFFFLLFVFSSTVPAQNTALVADGNPGDPVAEGQHVYYTAGDGTFTVRKNGLNGVDFAFSNNTGTSWYVELASSDATPLQVREYLGAAYYGTSGKPGLAVTFNSGTCSEVSGDFSVQEIVYGENDEILAFHATFTQYCGDATGALTGELLYQSGDPLPPKNRITSPATATGTKDHPFSYSIFASNNPAKFTASGLPPGLTANATSGLISGTPTKAGTYAVSVTATGAGGTANGTVTVTVLPAGQSSGVYTALYMHSEDGNILGQGRTYLFRSDNATFNPYFSPINFRLTAFDEFSSAYDVDLSVPADTSLGVGTYLNAEHPVSSVSPGLEVVINNGECVQHSGNFEIDELVTTGYTLQSSHASYLERCDGYTPAVWGEAWYKSLNAVTSDLLATATLGQPFSYQIIGNNWPTVFSATPLPPGLSIDTATGLISGTPAIGGIFRFPITASGPAATARSYLDLIVYETPGDNHPVVSGPEEAGGTLGKPFSYQIVAGPFNQYATSDLPAGLSVSADTGVISGIPQVTGKFFVNLLVTNFSGTSGRFLILSIYPPTPQITSPQSVTAVKGRQFAFQVVAANQPSFYNVSELPIGLTIGATDGLISGIPQDTGAYTATITASNGSGSTTQTLTVIVKATSSSQLLNLSTRLPVGTGDNVLIGGFIFQGGTPKTVLIRGLGPSLGDLGVQGTLADPVLELHDSTGVTIATNDNWRDSQAAEISATGLSPTSDLESAILATLPGDGLAYTAILRGQSGGTGVGLVEVYDVDEPNGSVLVNISTRGTVGTADNVLIGGFISGSGVGNVLVRALGPSLAGAGVTGVLADPVLELHDIEGNLVASNDNWKDSQADQIEGTGIPPTDDHESAIFATLPAGAYTAVVQGKDNGTGIGLVETYLIE